MTRSGVDFQLEAETRAGGAGAVRRVEGEGARLDLVEFQRDARSGSCACLGERLAAGRAAFSSTSTKSATAHAVGELQRRFHRVGQALADAVLDHQTVHHHLDGVLLLLGELDVVGQLPSSRRRSARARSRRQRSSSSRSTNSPLRPLAPPARESGNSRAFRVASSSVSATICCGVCAAYQGSPHSGQCGMPVRANSSRR